MGSQTLRQHYSRAHGSSGISQIAFHPGGELLMSASVDRTLRLWDLRAGRLRSTIRGHEEPVYGCCWDPDGNGFLSCDASLIHVWKLGLSDTPQVAAAPQAGARTVQGRAAGTGAN